MKKRLSVFIFLFLSFLIFTDLKASLQGKIDTSKPVLKVTVLDVWQGDSIFIQLPNKKTILVDGGLGGSKYSRFDAGKMVIAPYLKENRIKRLDKVIMSHPHSDHIGGLVYLLKKFKVDEIYDSGMSYTTELYLNCLTVVDKKKIKYKIPDSSKNIKADPRVKIRVLHPSKDWEYAENPNDNSIILHIRYKKVSFLLTGDMEDVVEAYLMEEGVELKSTVLKVAHHGSDTSSSDDFIDAVSPEIAVISVGKNNKFGHPSPSVIASYQDQDVKILRTDFDGEITFLTDGNHYQVKTQKIRRGKRK